MQKLDGIVVAGELSRCGELVAVFEAGLIAMVAVGDEDGPRGHQSLDERVGLLVGHDPEPVLDPEMVGRHPGGAVAQARFDCFCSTAPSASG